MKRTSDLKMIADFICAQFFSSNVKRLDFPNSIVICAPYLPGIVCSMVSFDVRIAVYACPNHRVRIRLYKYE